MTYKDVEFILFGRRILPLLLPVLKKVALRGCIVLPCIAALVYLMVNCRFPLVRLPYETWGVRHGWPLAFAEFYSFRFALDAVVAGLGGIISGLGLFWWLGKALKARLLARFLVGIIGNLSLYWILWHSHLLYTSYCYSAVEPSWGELLFAYVTVTTIVSVVPMVFLGWRRSKILILPSVLFLIFPLWAFWNLCHAVISGR